MRFSFRGMSVGVSFLFFAISVAAKAQSRFFAPEIPHTPPHPAVPRRLNLPTPQTLLLKNGLRVMVVERPQSGLVTMRFAVRAGSIHDDNLPGLASVTASLLIRGTLTKNGAEIAEAVESLGGGADVRITPDYAVLKLDALSTQWQPALELLGEMVRYPAFRTDEAERQRLTLSGKASAALRDSDTTALLAANRLIYGAGGYGAPVEGTMESLARIRPADIAHFYEKIYLPEDSSLIIVGDISAKNAFAAAARLFGNWKSDVSANPRQPVGVSPFAGKRRRILILDTPETNRAAVVMAHRAVGRADSDFSRLLVANELLHQSVVARLSDEIKDARLGENPKSGGLRGLLQSGDLTVSVSAKNENAALLARLLWDEWEKMTAKPAVDSELTAAKNRVLADFTANWETDTGIADRTAESFFAKGENPSTALGDCFRLLNGINTTAVQQAAFRHLNTAEAILIIVGDQPKFYGELKRRFPGVAIESIPLESLDLNRASLFREPENVSP